MKAVAANQVAELTFEIKSSHAELFYDVEMDAVFRTPEGKTLLVPAFWAGGNRWKLRYASPKTGLHEYRTECWNKFDGSLHGLTGSIKVTEYTGKNVLYEHGPVHVADDQRHFAHDDGTPFFWLGDTWWMGLCKRLQWPGEFKTLTADRIKKGFTVVQIVAGLYPDMGAFDPRGANEFGFPWTQDYSRINPEYFDLADQRIDYLVENGISPCIVGAWGYHLPWLGEERMKQHWRYLIARWGAYPVSWGVAGEENLPYCLEKGVPVESRKQAAGR